MRHREKRKTAESRKKVSVFWLKKQGYISRALNGRVEGGLSWHDHWGVKTASLGFILDLSGKQEAPFIWLALINNDRADCLASMVRVPCRYGGERWYFKCRSCDKKACILYLHEERFLCRRCANLTYDRCNDSKRMRRYPAGMLYNYWKSEKIYMQLKRETYAGKPTRKYRRYLKLKGPFSEEEVADITERALVRGA